MILGAVIGLGIDLASSISQKNKQKKELKNNLTTLESDKKELEKWYNTASNSDFIDSTTTKESVTALSLEKQQQDRERGNNAIRNGATPEAEIAKAASSNKAYSDAVYNLASIGNNYKSKINDIYFQNKKELNSRENQLKNSNTANKINYSNLINAIK